MAIINGTSGNDLLNGVSADASDTIDGLLGVDTVTYATSVGGVTVNLLSGVNTGSAAQGDILLNIENITGSANNDTLTGNDLDNVLSGGAGNDIMQGGKGNDTLDGGDGNDNMRGGRGDDQLTGGLGNDSIYTDFGNDVAQGGEGSDWIDDSKDTWGASLNQLQGNQGNDSIFGGSGIDLIRGGKGNDLLLGNDGDDVIYGDKGGDSVWGGLGNDAIYLSDNGDAAEIGVDFVYFNINATPYAGDVADADTVYDFKQGVDKIRLLDNASAANAIALGTVVALNIEGGQVTLEGNKVLFSNGSEATFAGLTNIYWDDFDGVTAPVFTGPQDVLGEAFQSAIAGFNPANIVVEAASALSIADVVALLESGLDLDNLTYEIADSAATVQAALSTPALKAILENADLVTAAGDELDNPLAFSAFGPSINLRVEAGDGDDSILAGKGDDSVVGGEGADQIALTTNDLSSDDVVYTDADDGASFNLARVTFGALDEDYRQGGQLSIDVEIDGEWNSYYYTIGADVAGARDAVLADFAQQIHAQLAQDYGNGVAKVTAENGVITVRSKAIGENAADVTVQDGGMNVSAVASVYTATFDSAFVYELNGQLVLNFRDQDGGDHTIVQDVMTSGVEPTVVVDLQATVLALQTKFNNFDVDGDGPGSTTLDGTFSTSVVTNYLIPGNFLSPVTGYSLNITLDTPVSSVASEVFKLVDFGYTSSYELDDDRQVGSTLVLVKTDGVDQTEEDVTATATVATATFSDNPADYVLGATIQIKLADGADVGTDPDVVSYTLTATEVGDPDAAIQKLVDAINANTDVVATAEFVAGVVHPLVPAVPDIPEQPFIPPTYEQIEISPGVFVDGPMIIDPGQPYSPAVPGTPEIPAYTEPSSIQLTAVETGSASLGVVAADTGVFFDGKAYEYQITLTPTAANYAQGNVISLSTQIDLNNDGDTLDTNEDYSYSYTVGVSDANNTYAAINNFKAGLVADLASKDMDVYAKLVGDGLPDVNGNYAINDRTLVLTLDDALTTTREGSGIEMQNLTATIEVPKTDNDLVNTLTQSPQYSATFDTTYDVGDVLTVTLEIDGGTDVYSYVVGSQFMTFTIGGAPGGGFVGVSGFTSGADIASAFSAQINTNSVGANATATLGVLTMSSELITSINTGVVNVDGAIAGAASVGITVVGQDDVNAFLTGDDVGQTVGLDENIGDTVEPATVTIDFDGITRYAGQRISVTIDETPGEDGDEHTYTATLASDTEQGLYDAVGDVYDQIALAITEDVLGISISGKDGWTTSGPLETAFTLTGTTVTNDNDPDIEDGLNTAVDFDATAQAEEFTVIDNILNNGIDEDIDSLRSVIGDDVVNINLGSGNGISNVSYIDHAWNTPGSDWDVVTGFQIGGEDGEAGLDQVVIGGSLAESTLSGHVDYVYGNSNWWGNSNGTDIANFFLFGEDGGNTELALHTSNSIDYSRPFSLNIVDDGLADNALRITVVNDSNGNGVGPEDHVYIFEAPEGEYEDLDDLVAALNSSKSISYVEPMYNSFLPSIQDTGLQISAMEQGGEIVFIAEWAEEMGFGLSGRMGPGPNLQTTTGQFTQQTINSPSSFDLDTNEFGIVSDYTNRVNNSFAVEAANLTDADAVSNLLNEVFSFGSDIQPLGNVAPAVSDGVRNTSIFAVTASDNSNQTAIWVHTQADADDNTVSADELQLLSILNTDGGEDSSDFDTDNLDIADLSLIDFEGLMGGEIPDGYRGLNWDGGVTAESVNYGNTMGYEGYNTVTTSFPMLGDSNGVDFGFSSADEKDFDFVVGNFAARDMIAVGEDADATVTVSAWDDGIQIGSATFSLSTNRATVDFLNGTAVGATDVVFDGTFDNVDEIRFSSDNAFVMDDLLLKTEEEGSSRVFGTPGDDVLEGNDGINEFTGNGGSDVFVFNIGDTMHYQFDGVNSGSRDGVFDGVLDGGTDTEIGDLFKDYDLITDFSANDTIQLPAHLNDLDDDNDVDGSDVLFFYGTVVGGVFTVNHSAYDGDTGSDLAADTHTLMIYDDDVSSNEDQVGAIVLAGVFEYDNWSITNAGTLSYLPLAA